MVGPETHSLNGRLPDSALRPIAGGRLEVYAAAAWNALNVQARKRGVELLPSGSKSSYRTYEQQVELYAVYQAGGPLAAVPGTSNHGWGLAVDVATHEMRLIVDQIGAPFGWSKAWSDAPSEWWHLKYKAGVWSGADPGPYGVAAPALKAGGVAVASSAAGVAHVFYEAADGSIWYAYDRSAVIAPADLRPFAPPPKV